MTGKTRLTISLAKSLISSGRITKYDLVSYCHAMAIAGEEHLKLNAFTQLHSLDHVLEQVSSYTGDDGPLSGIPLTVKANVAVKEFSLTASSRMLLDINNDTTSTSCGYDADVIRILKDAGAVVMGITQMDEFGMGSLGTNLGETSFGHKQTDKSTARTLNPLFAFPVTDSNLIHPPETIIEHKMKTEVEWIQEITSPYDKVIETNCSIYIPNSHENCWYTGGSSSGSAASVAHGSSLFSVASDTGGSIRLPAAWCGITGFKPTYGHISRKGLVSYASSLDTIGFLAPSVECISTVMKVMDTSVSDHITDSTRTIPKQSKSKHTFSDFRVGIPSAFSVAECPPEINDAWENAATSLEQMGATLVEVPPESLSPDIIKASLAAYYIIASAEASSNLSRYDGLRYGLSVHGSDHHIQDSISLLESQYAASRSMGFGQEVLRRILTGTAVLSSDRFHSHYEAASKIRAVVSKQLRQTLEGLDVILTPTCLSFPDTSNVESTAMFANDVLTVPTSLACLPAISIPWYIPSRKPLGLQIIGDNDNTVLEVAEALQKISLSREH
jgi:aspartyl-tRNA(Asn)/glutamyl-tRNA(Gln) amidotransferase subunit A